MMSRPRRSVKHIPIIESDSDDDEIPTKKLKNVVTKKKAIKSSTENANESSSSESDIENYLQPIDKLDFNSDFFNLKNNEEKQFDGIEKSKEGMSRLSDSDSNEEDKDESTPTTDQNEVDTPNVNFQQLEDFTKKIEEAKLHIEKYNAKTKVREKNQNISNLLAAGETKQLNLENIKEEDLHPSDFETTDDEWEEVKVKESQEEKQIIPKQDIEIRVGDMPEPCRKKKGVDLLAAMKRRLNRIRKENQVFVHKVHLLCWIAHGNFVNSVLNNTEILPLALSLLPSEKSYPSDRPDLGYLEKIVQWYKKTIRLTDKAPLQELTLMNSLKLQMKKKECFSKNEFVLIFIALLRALGIQCRLVLSLQVEPLRPPSSDLHHVSNKDPSKNEDASSTSNSGKTVKVKESKVSLGKSKIKTESKLANEVNKSTVSKPNLGKLKQSKGTSKESSSTKNSDKPAKSTGKDQDEQDKTTSRRFSTRKKEEKEKQPEKSVKVDKGKKVELPEKSSRTQTRKRDNGKLPEETNTKKKTVEKNNSIHNAKKDTLNVDEKKTRSKSASSIGKKTAESTAKTNKDDLKVEVKKTRSKSESVKKTEETKTGTKSVLKVKLPRYDMRKKSKEKEIPQLDGANDENDDKKSRKGKLNLERLKNKPPPKECADKRHSRSIKSSLNEDDSEDEFSPSPPKKSKRPNLAKLKQTTASSSSSQLDVKNDIINLIKGRISEQKITEKRRTVNNKRKNNYNESESDSDYMPEPIKKKQHDSESDGDYFVPKTKVKKRIRVKNEGGKLKVLSSDDEADKKKKKGINIWVEVFLESEEKWISADVIRGQVHCVSELYMRASHPVSYIVAWNNDNTLKDVSKRYCKNFNTVTRKLRTDAKWWEESLRPFLEKQSARSRDEDADLDRQQLDQPLPKAISEYKNHPLYALQRHILRFEALFPPDMVPLGYVRSEPVYPRSSVYICKTREIWLKEARTVKPGEKPYKIIKARPRYDRLSNKIIRDKLLELYGIWQTVDYDPPTAENGIVPRNAYGNVELFKPCMLPKGTVQLRLPGLNKVCKRLNIDCASAIVGFDFHNNWSHPVYDGFVVCKEFEKQLIAEWELEQEEIERKENEKIEKRVYTNWKKLIKGLLIRERLKARYDFGGETSGGGKGKKKINKGPRLATKKRRSPSGSESDAT